VTNLNEELRKILGLLGEEYEKYYSSKNRCGMWVKPEHPGIGLFFYFQGM